MVIQYLWKLVTAFHKKHPDKPTATSSSVKTIPQMAKPTNESIGALTTKQEQGRLAKANSVNKYIKKNYTFKFLSRFFGLILIAGKRSHQLRVFPLCSPTFRFFSPSNSQEVFFTKKQSFDFPSLVS